MKLGLKEFSHDVRSERYRFRQAVGGASGVFLVVLAQPNWWGFITDLAGALLRL